MVFGAPLTEEGIAQIYQLIEYLSKSEYHVFIPPQPLLLTCPLRLVLYFICTFYENKKPVCLSLVQTLCPSPFLLCPVVVYLASKHSIDFFFISSIVPSHHVDVHVEGLFRVPGNSLRQAALREMLNAGTEIDLETGDFHPNDAATLLKTYLGELPEPLLTHRHYHAHLKIGGMC